jgi:hypothetical protein
MNAQAHYWNQFVRLKRDSIYIGRYQGADEITDRNLNIFSAVASSASIGGWVIWKDYATVWAAIIAISQILTVIRPHLPYRTRLKSLAALCVDLEALSLVAETDWFKVSRGTIEEAEIHALTMALKTKAQRATAKAFGGATLPEKSRLLHAANEETRDYMNAFDQEISADV